MEYSSPMLK